MVKGRTLAWSPSSATPSAGERGSYLTSPSLTLLAGKWGEENTSPWLLGPSQWLCEELRAQSALRVVLMPPSWLCY